MNDNIDWALMQGKPFSIYYSSRSNPHFTLTGLPNNNAQFHVLLTRSSSRRQSVLANFLPKWFTGPVGEWNQSTLYSCWHGPDPTTAAAAYEESRNPVYDFTRDTFRFQLQAGPRLWPSMPMSSLGESYMQPSAPHIVYGPSIKASISKQRGLQRVPRGCRCRVSTPARRTTSFASNRPTSHPAGALAATRWIGPWHPSSRSAILPASRS